jgi:hypothetical protein
MIEFENQIQGSFRDEAHNENSNEIQHKFSVPESWQDIIWRNVISKIELMLIVWRNFTTKI